MGGWRDFAGDYWCGDVVGDFVREFEDSVEGGGEGLEIFSAADAETNAVGEGFDLLGAALAICSSVAG